MLTDNEYNINMTELYNIYIYEKYKELKNSGNILDNNDL